LVTGAAGFIGSQLCERLLLDMTNEVIGIDAFINSSTRWRYEWNIRTLLQNPRFHFFEQNLLDTEWKQLLPQVDVIYHLAGIPGVRSSWGSDFQTYITNHILVTQQMLEACSEYHVQKFIFASTSSIYGQKAGKVSENADPAPLSPYGVSKLTGEHLCQVYYRNFGIPIVILRYFTVYGPRQRPDMAFHRFIKQMLRGHSITVYGDGLQTRDFTYISDCVEATAAVMHASRVIGEKINIGGKERASVLDVIATLEGLFNQKASIQFLSNPRGEPRCTWADISKAEKLLQYEPKVDLKTGLANELHDLMNFQDRHA
jgi:nucleoside-diphosphate-sugar epimerase